MTWIVFLYTLIQKHTPITPGEVRELQTEAESWYNSDNVNDSKIGQLVKKYGNQWWVKTFLAISFVWASRSMHNFMNPTQYEENE